jgi:DNA polymerase III sliding clamp (beta) subunit (PCNA family)
MKLTMTTSLLQTMVARSMKGASNNKMIPITSLMAIELKDHKFTLTTSDATNYLYISENNVDGDDFYVVVQADIFSKLIARLTCEKVSMELKDHSLVVTGNGKYSIELPLDEEGELIKYPSPIDNFTYGDKDEIHKTTVDLILNTAKVSLMTNNEIPCYEGYYIGDEVIATDTCQVCGIKIKLFNQPALISSEMMDLLAVMTDEKIDVYRDGDSIVFSTPDCVVYGKVMDCISDFQVDAINGLLEEQFPSSCRVSKDELLRLLDRLSLFVGIYDKNGIYLTFTKEGLMVESKQANSSELIAYQDSKDFTDFTCCIDIIMLQSQIKASAGDSINIQYGEENAIKLTDGNVTQILALLEDDRVEA